MLLSPLPGDFPAIDMASAPLGIFGTEVSDERVLQAGDRVEVYRPLLSDPREERRQRAAAGKTMGRLND